MPDPEQGVFEARIDDPGPISSDFLVAAGV